MKTVNVGTIGLENMGRLHMINCLHMDGVKVNAAADQSKTGQSKARALGIKNLYEDYHDLLNKRHACIHIQRAVEFLAKKW